MLYLHSKHEYISTLISLSLSTQQLVESDMQHNLYMHSEYSTATEKGGNH